MCGTSWGPFCHVCLFAVEERRIFSPVGSRFSTGSLHRGFLGGFPRSKAQMGETKRMGQSHLGQPREGRQPKPIRQAENEIPVFALFAILANMDPRTMSELIAKKKKKLSQLRIWKRRSRTLSSQRKARMSSQRLRLRSQRPARRIGAATPVPRICRGTGEVVALRT